MAVTFHTLHTHTHTERDTQWASFCSSSSHLPPVLSGSGDSKDDKRSYFNTPHRWIRSFDQPQVFLTHIDTESLTQKEQQEAKQNYEDDLIREKFPFNSNLYLNYNSGTNGVNRDYGTVLSFHALPATKIACRVP
jgi:hypothetical protein